MNREEEKKDIESQYFDMLGEIQVLDVRIIKGETNLQEEKDKKLTQAILFKMKHNL